MFFTFQHFSKVFCYNLHAHLKPFEFTEDRYPRKCASKSGTKSSETCDTGWPARGRTCGLHNQGAAGDGQFAWLSA